MEDELLSDNQEGEIRKRGSDGDDVGSYASDNLTAK